MAEAVAAMVVVVAMVGAVARGGGGYGPPAAAAAPPAFGSSAKAYGDIDRYSRHRSRYYLPLSTFWLKQTSYVYRLSQCQNWCIQISARVPPIAVPELVHSNFCSVFGSFLARASR